jgi:digeranylgeranylglycerophospholipid reductase
VVIAEEHQTAGEPLHCAGLVTRRGVPEFARRSILCEVKGARLHSPLGFILTLEAKGSRACVVDRSLFDKLMFHRAVDDGAMPLMGASARSVIGSRDGVRTHFRTEGRLETVHAKVLIGADGHRSICRRSAGLPPPRHLLTGIQSDLKGVEFDPDFVDLYLGRDIAPGFFAWSIPAGDLLRVGLCTWDAHRAPAEYLKKLLSRPQFAKGRKVSTAAGRIPIGAGRSAVNGRTMLVGDAACHAKPLSGGGVYTGVRGAELCAKVADAYLAGCGPLEDYDALWKAEFGRELSRAFRVRKVFLNLTDKKIEKALKLFSDPGVKRLLEEHGDIDYPASISGAVLKMAPKLAQFSPQIIRSLL